MGHRKLLEVLLKGLTLSALALVAWQPALHAQEQAVPEAAPKTRLKLLQFATVGILASFPDGSSRSGHGLVVAKRGQSLLIATAGHVVGNEAGDLAQNVQVTLLQDQDGTTTLYNGTVQPPGILDRDVAFVAIETSQPPPLPQAGLASDPPRPGNLVWILRAQPQTWSDQPGRVTTADNANIIFEGGGAAEGTSGAPLVGYGGIEGLTLQVNGPTTNAVSVAHVRQTFDANFSSEWQWVLQSFPSPQRIGWVRLRRGDSLSERFPSFVLLRNEAGDISLAPDRYMNVPEARYAIVVSQPGAARPDVTCDLQALTVAAYQRQDVNLNCRVDPAGDWQAATRTIRISTMINGSYPVTILDSSNRQVASGSGHLRDDRFLSLDIHDEQLGDWIADLEFIGGAAKGKATYAVGGRTYDFFMRRK